ncbi:hypothetical protein [Actinomadura sp. RB99]|uniref:hypothetical protein n=1 Tax=Actinomadura sp. RB99 TaxID=2691577 RepID=UPI00168512D1|nr:hypothetical protein [Actinomadura sp. RB99]
MQALENELAGAAVALAAASYPPLIAICCVVEGAPGCPVRAAGCGDGLALLPFVLVRTGLGLVALGDRGGGAVRLPPAGRPVAAERPRVARDLCDVLGFTLSAGAG